MGQSRSPGVARSTKVRIPASTSTSILCRPARVRTLRVFTGEERLGDQVPDDVELGYHLCYGDAGHKHFKEPDDTSKLVAVANALAADLRRRLDWFHLPVPIGRTDDAYYAPLSS